MLLGVIKGPNDFEKGSDKSIYPLLRKGSNGRQKMRRIDVTTRPVLLSICILSGGLRACVDLYDVLWLVCIIGFGFRMIQN